MFSPRFKNIIKKEYNNKKLFRLEMLATPTLIVDDSLMIIKIMKKALLSNTIDGHHFEESSIYTANDGMEAFEKMGEHNSIKLIISDINMPNLNGDEFIEILQDTGRLDELKVVFITSGTGCPLLKSSIKDKVLGVIYKPFRYDGFNEQFNKLEKKKALLDAETIRIKDAQIEQKKHIENICIKYFNEFEIVENKEILNVLIDENFENNEISKDEYLDIVHAILSMYMFDVECEHKIMTKKIQCILKHLEPKVKIDENRLQLIDGFESQIEYVQSNELKLREILEALTTPLLDKISLSYVKVKKFPQLKSQLFSPHFDFIIDELTDIDCYFLDDELQKMILEQKEIARFNSWMYNFLEKGELDKNIKEVEKSSNLKTEIIKRLKYSRQRSALLSHYYCGQIEFHIWKRAKKSVEISQYLKAKMSKIIPSTSRYLVHKGKLTEKEHNKYIDFEKQNVIVLSNDLEKLEIFKSIDDAPFEMWNFLCYTKLSLLESWIGNNKPEKIILDYSFSSSVFDNGVQCLKLLVKKYPIFKDLIKLDRIYMIVSNNSLVKAHKYIDEYNFKIIHEPLEDKGVKDILLYG